jgi:hypothetical protein
LPRVKTPNARLDGNANLRSPWRTEYILGFIHRARAAGLPEEVIAYSAGDEAWYTELLYQITELGTCQARTLSLNGKEQTSSTFIRTQSGRA